MYEKAKWRFCYDVKNDNITLISSDVILLIIPLVKFIIWKVIEVYITYVVSFQWFNVCCYIAYILILYRENMNCNWITNLTLIFWFFHSKSIISICLFCLLINVWIMPQILISYWNQSTTLVVVVLSILDYSIILFYSIVDYTSKLLLLSLSTILN